MPVAWKEPRAYENEMGVVRAKVRIVESGWEHLKQKNEDFHKRAERAEAVLEEEMTPVRKIYTE